MKATARSRATTGRRRWSRWWMLLVAGLCGVGAYWAFIRPTTEPPSPDLAQAEPAVAQVVTAARDAVVANPRDADTWGHLGMVLHGHEFLAASRDAYAEAERLNPNDAAWPYLIGDTLWTEGRRDDAVIMFRRADERSGTDQTAALRLAEALLDQGRIDEAERAFERVLAREPQNPRALSGTARLRLARGDTDGALQRAQAATRVEPRRRTHFELLIAVHRARRDEAAAASVALPSRREELPWPDRYLDAVESRRTTLPAIARRAANLLRGGRGQEALALMKTAAARYPNSVEAIAGLGRMHAVLGQRVEGEALLRKALSLDSRSSDTRMALGTLLAGQSRCAEAIEQFRTVIEAQPDAAEAHLELGQCLYALGDKAGAVAATRNAVQYEPGNVQARMNLGTVLYELGRNEEALEQLTAAARLMPGDPSVSIERLKSALGGSRSGGAR